MFISTKRKEKKKSDFCHENVFGRTSEAKKSGKKETIGKQSKGQRKKCKDSFFFFKRENFLFKKKTQKKERCNGCAAAEINDNTIYMDLTRSTTSRHAAMVKRAFNRARDPQRMWISRDYHKMRYGQKHFCYTGSFCGKGCYSKQQKRKRNFLRRSIFFFERGISKKKIEKWLKNFLSFQMSNDRNSENIFQERIKQVFLCQKKVTFILFERTRLKNHKK